MSKIAKFEPKVVGEGYRFDPDEILESAKGEEFSTVCVIGHYPDGRLWISGSANAGETMMLLELAKHHLLFGEG
jgi:ligand-binding sensor domain-containing protein